MKILVAVLLAALCACALGQSRNDPLTSREVDLLRDTAQQPPQRIRLLISFAEQRMLAAERLRNPARPGFTDPDKVSDLLGELAAVVDELDDNLAMYNGHSEDLRHALRHVLDAEEKFLKRLNALEDGAPPQQKRSFAAALADASESVRSSRESAQAMLTDQIAKKGEAKEKEKIDHHENKKTAGTRDSDPEHD